MLTKAVIVMLTASTAQTETAAQSAYYRLAECAEHQLPDEPVWETACRALADWSLFIHATEHGAAIAYAHDGSARSAFTRPPMMRLYGGFNDTVEFRSTVDSGPYATIHRYVSQGPAADADQPQANLEDVRHDLLLVTALKPGEPVVACPLGYIDASQIAQANAAARSLADAFAPAHVCDGAEPRIYTDYESLTAEIEALQPAPGSEPGAPQDENAPQDEAG